MSNPARRKGHPEDWLERIRAPKGLASEGTGNRVFPKPINGTVARIDALVREVFREETSR